MTIHVNFTEVEPGDHLCLLYDKRESKLYTEILFIVEGLKENELVEVCDEEEIVSTLNEVVDAESFMERGQLVFLSKEELYLEEGILDVEKILESIAEYDEKALIEGYKGLRIVGDATWVQTHPKAERFLEFEAKLNKFLPLTRCKMFCLFDERKLNPDLLLKLLQTHPKVVSREEVSLNPNYIPPELFLKELWKGESVQKLIERKFRKEFDEVERKFKLLFHSPFDAIIFVKDSKVSSCNPTALKMLGYRRFRDLIGKKIGDLSEEISHRIEIANKKPQFFELELKKPDGSKAYLELSLTKVNDSFLIIARDVTERKEMERKLKESEERFRKVFESAPILLAILNRDGVFIEANREVVKFLGRNPVGKSLFDLLSKEDAERRIRLIREVIDKGKKIVFEDSWVEKREAKPRYFRNTLLPIKIADETYCIAISKEITEKMPNMDVKEEG